MVMMNKTKSVRHGVGINSEPEPIIVNTTPEPELTKEEIKLNQRKETAYNMMQHNASIMRSDLLLKLLNPGKDINFECGYPDAISTYEYRLMYERMGIAARVVDLLPEESWAIMPEIYETEDANNETEFEKIWNELDKKRHILQYLQRVDILSGVGRYGILLIGINDGKDLREPVDGIDLDTGEATGTNKYELLYLKPFDEYGVEIHKKEEKVTSPRYGYPIEYSVKIADPMDTGISCAPVARFRIRRLWKTCALFWKPATAMENVLPFPDGQVI